MNRALVLAITCLAALAAAPSLAQRRPPLLADGTKAPDFAVEDRDGRKVKLADLKGKVVVLDFWGSWCTSCERTLPHTNEVARKYAGKGVVVLAIATSDHREAFDVWLAKHADLDSIRFTLDTSPDGDEVAGLYRVSVVPSQFVIGKDGRVSHGISGSMGPASELEDAIKRATAPGARGSGRAGVGRHSQVFRHG